jgi:cytidylate kinase
MLGAVAISLDPHGIEMAEDAATNGEAVGQTGRSRSVRGLAPGSRPNAAVHPTGHATTDRRGSGMTNGAARPSTTADDVRRHDADAMKSPLHPDEDVQPATGEDHRRVIAIDGPAAAGKTTVARALADRLGATYLDTGLLYRGVTLLAQRAGLPPTDGEAIAALARRSRFQILPPAAPDQIEQLLVNDEPVTPFLRTPEVDRDVSAVSAHPEVRAALLPIQRRIADGNRVVIVGRDITTVVVPDAGVKVYLNASPAERARRRLKEIEAQGRNERYESILREIERRDRADSSRAIAPLRAAGGVTVVETDGRSVAAVVDEIAELARRAWHDLPPGRRNANDR